MAQELKGLLIDVLKKDQGLKPYQIPKLGSTVAEVVEKAKALKIPAKKVALAVTLAEAAVVKAEEAKALLEA